MLCQAEYPALVQLFPDKPVPSGSFLQPLRREICAHDAAAHRAAGFGTGTRDTFGLLYVPALKLASTLSKIGLFGLQPFRLFALLLLFALAHWLPLRVLPWKLQADNEEFHRGRSVSFFIISFVSLILAIPLVAYLFDREALRAFFP